MNLNKLDLNKLAVFSKVADAGNYRLASELLNVTPSALSQTITTLENSLGIPLFYRCGKKMVLTEEGSQIQHEFKTHHHALTEAFGRIAGKKDLSGMLHVGAYLEFAKFQLAPFLARFQKKFPGVQIKLVFDTPTRLHRLLEDRKIDVCFSIFPDSDSRMIECLPIFHEELVFLAPKGMLLERPSYKEVVSTPMVEYYFNHQPMRRWLSLHFNKKPRQLPIRTFGSSAEMVLALIQEGLGVGVVPEYLLQPKLPSDLTICRPTSKKLKDSIWMLRWKNKESPAILRVFSQELDDFFKLPSPFSRGIIKV